MGNEPNKPIEAEELKEKELEDVAGGKAVLSAWSLALCATCMAMGVAWAAVPTTSRTEILQVAE